MRKWLLVAAACCLMGGAFSQQRTPRPDEPAFTDKEIRKQDASKGKRTQAIPMLLPGNANANSNANTNVVASGTLNVQGQYLDKTARPEPSKWDDPVTWFTFVIAVANLFLWWSTRSLAREAVLSGKTAQITADSAKLNAAAVMAAERAWLVCAFEAPGLNFESDRMASLTISVRNAGNTPATITDIYIGATFRDFDSALPKDWSHEFVDDHERHIPSGYLVRGDSVPRTKHILFREEERKKLSEQRLWVYAFVDYIDAFGARFRFTTARIYEPAMGDDDNTASKLNLMYPSGLYDFVRSRKNGEGNDGGIR